MKGKQGIRSLTLTCPGLIGPIRFLKTKRARSKGAETKSSGERWALKSRYRILKAMSNSLSNGIASSKGFKGITSVEGW